MQRLATFVTIVFYINKPRASIQTLRSCSSSISHILQSKTVGYEPVLTSKLTSKQMSASTAASESTLAAHSYQQLTWESPNVLILSREHLLYIFCFYRAYLLTPKRIRHKNRVSFSSHSTSPYIIVNVGCF